MYKKTYGTSILRLSDMAYIPNDPQNTDYQGYLAWVAEGNNAIPIDPSPPPTEQDFINAVQNYLDGTAQSHGYDGIMSACTYTGSSNPRFQAEGRACLDWRDKVWTAGYRILQEVQDGKRQVPSLTGIIDELPQIVWPDVPYPN